MKERNDKINNASFPTLWDKRLSYTGWRRETNCGFCGTIKVCAEIREDKQYLPSQCSWVCEQCVLRANILLERG